MTTNMEGRWGRRVFGTVRRGKKFTLFTLTYTLRNGVRFEESWNASNLELSLYPKAYGYILNELCAQLEKRVEDRLA